METNDRKLVFISHAHEDSVFCQSFVLNLKYALKVQDIEIFYDEVALDPGDEWLEIMHQQITSCPIFILILSRHSILSRFVKREISLAVQATISDSNRRFYTFKIDDAQPNEIWSLISSYQMANAQKHGFLHAFDQLVKAINVYMQREQASQAHTDGISDQHKIEQIDALRGEIEQLFADMNQYKEVYNVPVWVSLSGQRWFLDLSREAEATNALKVFYSAVSEYQELPWQRGSGHIIESWVANHELTRKCREAESKLIMMRLIDGK